MREKSIGDRSVHLPAESLPAHSEPCLRCNHGLEHHPQADRCRFEDCACHGYDGPEEEPEIEHQCMQAGCSNEAAPGYFCREHVDPPGVCEPIRLEDDYDTPYDQVSRDGHWPASIGSMPVKGQEVT